MGPDPAVFQLTHQRPWHRSPSANGALKIESGYVIRASFQQISEMSWRRDTLHKGQNTLCRKRASVKTVSLKSRLTASSSSSSSLSIIPAYNLPANSSFSAIINSQPAFFLRPHFIRSFIFLPRLTLYPFLLSLLLVFTRAVLH